MKINETQRIGAINQYKRLAEGHVAPGSDKRIKKRDQVEISPEAKELLEAQSTASKERIEELRQSVDAGTYHVDAHRIAEKLLPFIR